MNILPIYFKSKVKNFQLEGNQKSFFSQIKMNFLFLETFKTENLTLIGDSIRELKIYEIDKSIAKLANNYFEFIQSRILIYSDTTTANDYFSKISEDNRLFWEFKGNKQLGFPLSENKLYELTFTDGTNQFESELFYVIAPPCFLLTPATEANFKINELTKISANVVSISITVPNKFTYIDLYVSYDDITETKLTTYSANGINFTSMPYLCLQNTVTFYIQIDTTSYFSIRAYNFLNKCIIGYSEKFSNFAQLEIVDIPEVRTVAGEDFTDFSITLYNGGQTLINKFIQIIVDTYTYNLFIDIEPKEQITYSNIVIPTNVNSGGVKHVYFAGTFTDYKVHIDLPAIKVNALCKTVTTNTTIIPYNFHIQSNSFVINNGTASAYKSDGLIKFSTSGTAYNIIFKDSNNLQCVLHLSENNNGIGNIIHGQNSNNEPIYAIITNSNVSQQSKYFSNHSNGFDIISDNDSIKTIVISKNTNGNSNYITPL